MSVLNMGADAVNKLFLEYIMPGLNTEIRANSVLYDRFETDIDHVVGKYAVFKCLTSSAKSARPSSSTTFPTAKQGVYNEFIIYMKRGLYASLQFDNLAVACSQGKGAVMDVLEAELSGIKIHIANKMNRQFWGDGSGRLAQVMGAVSASATVPVDSPIFGTSASAYTNPSNYLDEGQEVDFINPTTGLVEEEAVEISSIDIAGAGHDHLTMSRACTISDDAWVFDHDTMASSQAAGTGVPMGLRGIIATTDPYTGITPTYFQNIQRSVYAWARAQSTTMGGAVAAVTNAKILEAIMNQEKYGRTSVILSNDILWRCFYTILEQDKTMPNDPAFWGGLTGLTFYGGRAGKIPWIYDSDAPDETLHFLDDSLLKVFSPVKNGMAWLPGDNGILTRVSGKDEWAANLAYYYNFGTAKPLGLNKLINVKHAAS